MRLYEGDLQQFRADVIHNRIADKMAGRYEEYFKRHVSKSEYRSWENSLEKLKDVVDQANLKENKIILEYKLPNNNSRIDVLLFGKHNGTDGIILIELKQWSNDSVSTCEIEGNVNAVINGRERQVSHPSLQVEGYYYSLIDNLAVFEEKPEIKLYPIVYCHNYSRRNDKVLYTNNFGELIKTYPVFAKEDLDEISDYLKNRLSDSNGEILFKRFVGSRVKPTKSLFKYVKGMMEKQHVFNLIDDQIPARNAIIAEAKLLAKSNKKRVIIVKGGPGTGKSVIALETMIELLKQGKNVYYTTGSSAFTKTLRKVFGKRVSDRFKYFFSFTHHKENEVGVLICDEAHRLRKSSDDWGVPAHLRSGARQVDDLVRPARLSVFFIDEHQVVRPTEVGDVDLIRDAAKKFNAQVLEFELTTQFRSGGSDTYLRWLENTLDITPSTDWLLSKKEPMEFKIFDTPQELREVITAKNKQDSNSARIVAGFCWPWSSPRSDGTLVNDVKIADFAMPWENKNEAWMWATDPSGMDQVGTVYTSQGFEFDYIGVIFGKDLIYDRKQKKWAGKPENSHDPVTKRDQESFAKHVKNVYRVLMSRANKGVYVYFMDAETRDFFKSRIEAYTKLVPAKRSKNKRFGSKKII